MIYEDVANEAAETPQLVTHTRRPQWGIGMLVGEEAHRRRYQFEDGQLRVFREGFYQLLAPVDQDDSAAEELLSELGVQHEAALARKEISQRRREGDLTAIRMVDQIRVFTDLYPQGFEDPAFIEASRLPDEGKRACKRHVDAALDNARTRLDVHRLHKAVTAGQHEAVIADVIQALSRTDLVTVGRDLKPIKALEPKWSEEVSVAMFNLVLAASKSAEAETDDEYNEAFDHWIALLQDAFEGKAPSWQLATAPAALVAPEHHVLVQPTVFRLQARWVAPSLRWSDVPYARNYQRVRAMADRLRERLAEEPLPGVRDHFDTGRFIWETLRLKGRKHLEALLAAG